MKKLLIISLFVITTSTVFSRSFVNDVRVGMFYSSLRPYGDWILIDNDLLVWKPYGVHKYWKPYYEGRWLWTKHGWYWDSYEPFGWAVYHYGRWIFDDYYGWIWIPDNQWAPAWVEWRYDDYYIGWSPLPPYAEFRIDFGIHFSISWHSRYHYWNFVTFRNFCSDNVHRHIIVDNNVERFFNNTKYRTNYHLRDREIYNGGIDRNLIERKTKTRIAERNIRIATDRENIKSGNDKDIFVYRPKNENIKVDLNEVKRGDRSVNIEREKIVINKQNRESEIVSKPNPQSRGVEKSHDRIEVERKSRNDDGNKSEKSWKVNTNPTEKRQIKDRKESVKIERNKPKSEKRTIENQKVKTRVPEENREREVQKRSNDIRKYYSDARKRR